MINDWEWVVVGRWIYIDERGSDDCYIYCIVEIRFVFVKEVLLVDILFFREESDV